MIPFGKYTYENKIACPICIVQLNLHVVYDMIIYADGMRSEATFYTKVLASVLAIIA